MGRKSEQRYPGVDIFRNSVRVSFTYQGKQHKISLKLPPTIPNIKYASRLLEEVKYEIRNGSFTFEKHFPDYKYAKKTEATETRTLNEWASVWEKLVGRTLEASTLKIYKRNLNSYWLKYFGAEHPSAITHERVLTHLAELASGQYGKPLSRRTQNNVLIPLRGVFSLICKANKSIPDPTIDIENLTYQLGDPDPFSMEEVNIIIPAIEKTAGKIMADYFEFAIFAGLRSSEQIALKWESVSLSETSGTVYIHRARVLGEDKDRTKTAKAREVELNSRAVAILKRQKERTGHLEFVFMNPKKRKPWHDDQIQSAAWREALKQTKVRYRPPKECRDTSVTLALQAGADPMWVAKQHGHSLKVMLSSYAKWIPGADKGRNLDKLNSVLGSF